MKSDLVIFLFTRRREKMSNQKAYDSDAKSTNFLAMVVMVVLILFGAVFLNVRGHVDGTLVEYSYTPPTSSEQLPYLIPPEKVIKDEVPVPANAVVDKIHVVAPNESCMAITKRAGYPLTLTQCVRAARAAGREVLWYRPDLGKPATIFAPSLEAGEMVILLKEGEGEKRYRFMTPKELKQK